METPTEQEKQDLEQSARELCLINARLDKYKATAFTQKYYYVIDKIDDIIQALSEYAENAP